MTDLSRWIAVDEQALIEPEDREWLEGVFERFAGYPDLKQIWALMDEVWQALGCDPEVMDARIGAYYSHPVWLLNGLFIEQHRESLDNRRMFRDWVVKNAPERVAEFGGGFGSLARMIGEALPSASVEVIEPHPHPLAIARAEKTRNVRYRPEMQGEYDALIATDVFEHVTDPLQLVYETAQHLRQDGRYLIANCFFPVIRCHLPQTFHFRHSWDASLKAMGLEPAERVAYGRVYIRHGRLDLASARWVERRSLKLWRFTRYLPGRLARPITNLLMRS